MILRRAMPPMAMINASIQFNLEHAPWTLKNHLKMHSLQLLFYK